MKSSDINDLLQRAAGVVTWAVVTGLAAWILFANQATSYVPGFIALSTVNLGAMWLAMTSGGNRRQAVAATLVQLGSALAMGWWLQFDFLPIYTIIWIAIAAFIFSWRTTVFLFIAVSVAWYLIMRYGWQDRGALVSVMLYGTFHLFALLTTRTILQAEAARDRAETLNRELLATQHLLSEASRQGERTRIARDLHDLLGHHLTALTINLQIAERLSDGEAKTKVAESRALARLLLSDVRDAVDTLREEGGVDFEQAIRVLAENAPGLDVHVDIERGLDIDNVDVAQTVVRFVQEAMTNTLRHANASACWIRIWREADQLRLEVRDNGVAAEDIREGNGLTGMRERLAALQGSLEVDRFDKAFRLNVQIPLAH
ncbi:MAG: sensor histidine kinase [Pseudomonadota bacterium]